MAKNGGAATIDGPELQQPAPGSGAPQPAHDGREYWRREAHRYKGLADDFERRLKIADLVITGLHERIAALQLGGST